MSLTRASASPHARFTVAAAEGRIGGRLGFSTVARVLTPIPLQQTDEELQVLFLGVRTRKDVADLLAVSERELVYILYRGGKLYFEFELAKRAGGVRLITAPTGSIKILQKRLNQVIQAVYKPKAPVHGFTRGRSVLTNADRHTRKRVLLNVDLEDFFPSIHFGRVRGVFMSPPFSLPLEAAQVIAQICTHNTRLPQGAPTSPIVSNLVCGGLDAGLRRLAEGEGCSFTRYADDITFSTTRSKLPEKLAVLQTTEGEAPRVVVGGDLRQVIERNGFRINERKVRLRGPGQRLEVTGLVVHRGVNVPREYVRSLRGMLHAWERYGYAAAEAELHARHYRKHRRPGAPPVELRSVVSGKLEYLRMIRGVSNLLFVRLWNRYALLVGSPAKLRMAIAQTPEQIKDALWLLQSPTSSGTAFALEGYGLVTCAHCLQEKPVYAIKMGQVEERYEVTVTHVHEHLDLALLSIGEPVLSGLAKASPGSIDEGDPTIVAGYGNYAPGTQGRLVRGHITGKGVRFGVPVLYSDHRVFAGNSGGPVIDSAFQVVGVLQRAASLDAPEQETTILPIELLDSLPAVPAGPPEPAAPAC